MAVESLLDIEDRIECAKRLISGDKVSDCLKTTSCDCGNTITSSNYKGTYLIFIVIAMEQRGDCSFSQRVHCGLAFGYNQEPLLGK